MKDVLFKGFRFIGAYVLMAMIAAGIALCGGG
jgi:hypothetical protein